jgi:hypothetical protein
MLDLVDVIRTKKRIHIHFWMTLFWAIVDAKERANLAYARLMSEASDPADPIMLQSRTNWFQMDTEVLSKYPEYSTDISALESELAALLEELKNDERAFFHHAELTEKEHQRMKQRGEWAALDPDYKLKNAFDQNIKVWVDASDKLTSDALETDPDMRKEPSIAVALTMLDTMERANKMRRDYRVIEIYVPVEFSVITLLVGWFLSAPN